MSKKQVKLSSLNWNYSDDYCDEDGAFIVYGSIPETDPDNIGGELVAEIEIDSFRVSGRFGHEALIRHVVDALNHFRGTEKLEQEAGKSDENAANRQTCPFCGYESVFMYGRDGEYWGECNNRDCQAVGPVRGTEDDAFEAFSNPSVSAKRIKELEDEKDKDKEAEQ